jgi:hypothetical protein
VESGVIRVTVYILWWMPTKPQHAAQGSIIHGFNRRSTAAHFLSQVVLIKALIDFKPDRDDSIPAGWQMGFVRILPSDLEVS